MKDAVLACIRTRRSVRRYTEEEVSPEQLNALLEAAIWAPSGGNNQTWLFTAIRNKDILTKLNDILCRTFAVWTPDDAYPSKRRAVESAKKGTHNFFYHAPVLIIASNVPNYQNAMADCSTALQNIFLAAHAMGLGSCWINQLRWLRDEPPVRDYLTELGLPREHVICGAAAVGHPGHTPPPPARKEGTTLIVS